MLRLKLDGARLDKLLCLGQAALGDGNIHAGCFDSVTINNGAVDLFRSSAVGSRFIEFQD